MGGNDSVKTEPFAVSARGKSVSFADNPEVLERFHDQLELVNIIASQVARNLGRGVEFDDLLSAGREGLLDAARRYDEARGIPFRAYANFRVRGAILDGVRHMSALPRRAYERLAAMEAAASVSEGEAQFAFSRPAQSMSEDEAEGCLDEQLAVMATAAAIGIVTEASRNEAGAGAEAHLDASPELAYSQAEVLAKVRSAVAELAPTEREVISRHYFGAEGMEQIARDLNVSKSWVSRIHTRAVARLMKRLQGLDSPG
jgi:RNA polymerase sigma factor FliA